MTDPSEIAWKGVPLTELTHDQLLRAAAALYDRVVDLQTKYLQTPKPKGGSDAEDANR